MIYKKKSLGQHFLKHPEIARNTASAIPDPGNFDALVEIGPGEGMLTQFLAPLNPNLHLIEIDPRFAALQQERFAGTSVQVHHADFLEFSLHSIKGNTLCIAGNFPYNISSQIFFKILEDHHRVQCVVGMVQKEVALRLIARHGKKDYGILSVLLDRIFHRELLFDVGPESFSPPPKVQSAVLRMTHKNPEEIAQCDEALLMKLVKAVFNQRRKMLRNSISGLLTKDAPFLKKWLTLRPEQISPEEFVEITRLLSLHE